MRTAKFLKQILCDLFSFSQISALAYASMAAFIPKYLHKFFLKDNSPIIQGNVIYTPLKVCFKDSALTSRLE